MDNFYQDWKQRILAAHERIRSIITQTPVETLADFTPGLAAQVVFKSEHQQRTGSFKLRGAANKVSLMTPEQLQAGVITASNGNHGLAVAASAQARGIRAQVYVSSQVSANKLARIKEYGADIELAGENPLDAELAARKAAQSEGKVFISPYNDPDVVAGQGTIGAELLQQVRRIDAVFIAVGGGGLIGGIGAFIKAVSPNTQIVGCWAENSPVLFECLKAGRIMDVPEKPTLSESTAGSIEPGAITLDLAKKVIDKSVLVSEDEILAAMRKVRNATGWLIEGAAGVAVAAFLKQAAQYQGKTAVILLCGGNLSDKVCEAAMTQLYTRAQIEKVINPPEVIQAIEAGFVAYSQGKVVVPAVGHLDFDDPPGDCHIKYGYVRGGDTFTVKVATGFWKNLEQGLPSGYGLMLVFSSKTGALLAILQDEAYLTDVRTAAAGAVAAKYLAPSRIERIGIIGAGTQARLQLQYLKEVTPCRQVSLWARSPERAKAFTAPGFDIEVKPTVKDLAAQCQLIVTTTPATRWLLGANDVQPGTHITAVGADGGGKQELDPQLFRRAAVRAVDSFSQCAQFGDSSYAVKAGLIRKEDLVEVGNLIQDRSLGRQNDQQITIADLTGVAIQDIQIADLALRALDS